MGVGGGRLNVLQRNKKSYRPLRRGIPPWQLCLKGSSWLKGQQWQSQEV